MNGAIEVYDGQRWRPALFAASFQDLTPYIGDPIHYKVKVDRSIKGVRVFLDGHPVKQVLFGDQIECRPWPTWLHLNQTIIKARADNPGINDHALAEQLLSQGMGVTIINAAKIMSMAGLDALSYMMWHRVHNVRRRHLSNTVKLEDEINIFNIIFGTPMNNILLPELFSAGNDIFQIMYNKYIYTVPKNEWIEQSARQVLACIEELRHDITACSELIRQDKSLSFNYWQRITALTAMRKALPYPGEPILQAIKSKLRACAAMLATMAQL